jgi:hypothetical protein
MFFLLLIFSSFGFNQLSFFKHMLFWLLTTSGNNNYYINWHIVSFRQFRCCCDIKINRISLNIFYTSIFLRHSPYLCSTLKQIIEG